MIRCHHCTEAQTWATWALASLTHREERSGKYIGLTIEEGGYEARVFAKNFVFLCKMLKFLLNFLLIFLADTLDKALQDLVKRNQASPFILNKVRLK